MEEKITYTFWKTGEIKEELLNFNGVDRKPTSLYCPFDDTPIVHCSTTIWTSYECPNCKSIYSLSKKSTQVQVDKQAREKVAEMNQRIRSLSEQKKDLQKLIEMAVERRLFEGLHKEGQGPTSGTAD